jgi:hypothetical protein
MNCDTMKILVFASGAAEKMFAKLFCVKVGQK